MSSFVFIHGLNGHPQKSWTHSTGFFWPWELQTKLKHSRVLTFGYDADIKSSFGQNFTRIKSIAASLLSGLANERISDEVGYFSLSILLLEKTVAIAYFPRK
jgi:hypothetical protein